MKEAHRVLTPQGIAGFSIPGPRSNLTLIPSEVFKKYGLPTSEIYFTKYLGCAFDHEDFKGKLEDAGFQRIKIWTQPMYYNFQNGVEFFDYVSRGDVISSKIIKDLSGELYEKVKTDIISAYDTYSESRLDPDLLEVTIAVA